MPSLLEELLELARTYEALSDALSQRIVGQAVMAIKARESDMATAFELELLAAHMSRGKKRDLMLRAAEYLRGPAPSLPQTYRRTLRDRTRD